MNFVLVQSLVQLSSADHHQARQQAEDRLYVLGSA